MIRNLLFLGFLLGVRTGLGCSCAGPTPVCSEYWTTPLLFLGHVTRIEQVHAPSLEQKTINGQTVRIPSPGENVVYFDVAKTYRGAPEEQTTIHTPSQGSACGYSFEAGHDYLVYASSDANGQFETGHCSRTHEVKSAADDEDVQWIEALAHSGPGASIFGKISSLRPNEDGGYDAAGLAGISVAIRGQKTATVVSDSNGKFRADELPSGTYAVSASAPEGYSTFPSSKVTLKERGCAEIPWNTQLDGHIRGHVYDQEGNPAANLNLTVRSAEAKEQEPWNWRDRNTTSKKDGSFDFDRLAPGAYRLGVNMDFAPLDKNSYYRKAYYPGTANRTAATPIAVGAGERVDNLQFILPPDSLPPSIPISVTVLGFDHRPLPGATIIAQDNIWENSVTPIMGTTDSKGVAQIILRPRTHYDVWAHVNLDGSEAACAQPIGVEAKDSPAPVTLALNHHIGNCGQFRKRDSNSPR